MLTLRRDMNALRLSADQQQVYCGFNVPLHLQTPPPKGLEPDEAYREIFEAAVTATETIAPAQSAFKRKLQRALRAVICRGPMYEPPPIAPGKDAMYWELPCPPNVDLLSFLALLCPRPKAPAGIRRRIAATKFRLRMNLKYEWFLKRSMKKNAESRVRIALGSDFKVRVRACCFPVTHESCGVLRDAHAPLGNPCALSVPQCCAELRMCCVSICKLDVMGCRCA